LRFTEHLDKEDGVARVRARLQDGAGGHRTEEAQFAVQFRALIALAEMQEPGRTRGEARGREGLEPMAVRKVETFEPVTLGITAPVSELCRALLKAGHDGGERLLVYHTASLNSWCLRSRELPASLPRTQVRARPCCPLRDPPAAEGPAVTTMLHEFAATPRNFVHHAKQDFFTPDFDPPL
jgi:hypothetical protein